MFRSVTRLPLFLIVCGMSALAPTSSLRAQCGMEELSKIVSSDWVEGDAFGTVLAIDGDRAVMGATGVDCVAGVSCGAAYVFVWDGAAWVQEAKLVASDAIDATNFASSVAISGDRVVVGAYRDDDRGMNAGAAYVFRRLGGTWVQETKLTASDADPDDFFGAGVAILGDWLMVGATHYDLPGFENVGSVYVYRFDGVDWVEQQKLYSELDELSAEQWPNFGFAIAMDGDRALITAVSESCLGANVAISCGGVLYVFHRDGTTWVREDRFSGVWIGGCVPVWLGRTLDLEGDVALAADSDCMKVFRRFGPDWQVEARLVPPPLAQSGGTAFFHDVSLSGNTAVVGIRYADPNNVTNAGSAFVYRYDGTDWLLVEELGSPDATTLDNYGRAMAVDGQHLLVASRARLSPGGPTVDAVHAYSLPVDCNANGAEDSCDLAGGTSLNCNADLIPDECQLGLNDCNDNGVPDDCDIAAGTSQDADGNGFPDECCPLVQPALAEVNGVTKNRYIAVHPQNYGRRTALRVTLTSLNHPDPPGGPLPTNNAAIEGQMRWVGPPGNYAESSANPTRFRAASLQCDPYFTDWGDVGFLHIYGDAILPSSLYHVQTVYEACTTGVESNYSAALPASTGWWGDVAGPYQPTCAQSQCSPGSCTRERCATQPDAFDIVAEVDKFKSLPWAMSKGFVQLQPGAVDPGGDVSAFDIVSCVNAFKGLPYSYPPAASCPP